ncbi:hypothetical protein [Cellulomonas humilata]|uniref:Uncharacterized protein n=1 Tax=Cellulomonas humilata TaxID=144055 RepID=A0ABU0EIV7_9CELL|nr:hypothetical protein [Cellulomonas humilata]MDQ0375214.1 hypothetical protein [Cellulomonas humilata]
MTEQGVVGTRWLLRALLVVCAGLLLTVLGFSTSAHAADDAPGQGDAATTEPSTPVDDPVPAADDPDAPVVATTMLATVPVVDETEPVGSVPEVLEPAESLPEVLSAPEVPSDLPPEVDAPATPLPVVVDVRAAEVVGTLTPSSAPALDALRPPAPLLSTSPRARAVEHRPMTPAAADTSAPAVPVPAAVVAQTPCPIVAAPVVATARPTSPWSRGVDGGNRPQPDDLPPVVVAPPSVEHVRSGPSRGDDPVPADGPAALLPPAGSAGSSHGRAGADGDLPAEVDPPQLRVLSSRAGPCPTTAPAPQDEILDSPA